MRAYLLAVFIFAVAMLATGCVEMPSDTCRSYGFRPGSEAFAGCLQREMHQFQAVQMSILAGMR